MAGKSGNCSTTLIRLFTRCCAAKQSGVNLWE